MVEEIFQQGQKTRPAIVADVVVLIQETSFRHHKLMTSHL